MLGVRAHGEGSVIAQLLTRENGVYAGLVQGGRSKRLAPLLQPGNRVQVRWRARLSEHLGRFELDSEVMRAGRLLDDASALEAVRSACQLCVLALPEREATPELYNALDALIDGILATSAWPRLYVHWELGLLAQIGFGLDLRRCALTGEVGTITHVSPKSGRGVNADCAEARPFADKLLPVPGFLLGQQVEATRDELVRGLELSAYFLNRWVLWPSDRELPDSRARLAELILRMDAA